MTLRERLGLPVEPRPPIAIPIRPDAQPAVSPWVRRALEQALPAKVTR